MKTKQGFTLIEVVLVLGIAGLIFGMTFIALPALWASERDTERRDDVLSFIRNLKNYQTNNSRGALPGTSAEQNTLNRYNTITVYGEGINSGAHEQSWEGFYRDYFPEGFVDPDGAKYNLVIMKCNQKNIDNECTNSELNELYDGTFSSNDYNLRVVVGASCYGEKSVLSASQRKVAALYRLESGGVYCENT